MSTAARPCSSTSRASASSTSCKCCRCSRSRSRPPPSSRSCRSSSSATARRGGAGRARRGAQEGLDRVLVSAEDRSAQETARRRRGLRPLPPPAIRRTVARRLHARRDRLRADRRCPSWRSTNVLKAGLKFAKLGINLRFAVNIPVNALVQAVNPRHRARASRAGRTLAGTDHRRHRGADRHRSRARQRDDQAVCAMSTSSSRSTTSAAAIPRWRGSKELPFAELKLDRTFVTDCGTDKVNAPLCKTVIDLAHNFGSAGGRHRHREGLGRACPDQHGLRPRPGLPARPADAGGPFPLAAAPTRRRPGPPDAGRCSGAVASSLAKYIAPPLGAEFITTGSGVWVRARCTRSRLHPASRTLKVPIWGNPRLSGAAG